MGLEKLSMVSDLPTDQETYGVVDPDANKLEAGTAGMGKRVTLEDKKGNKLAEFIIGKKDPDGPSSTMCACRDRTASIARWSRPTSCRPSSRTGSKRTC